MRTPVQEEFLSIIRYEMAGTPLPDGFGVADMDALLKLASKQDLSHFVYDALTRSGIACSSEKALKQYIASLWRVEQMDHELAQMSKLFQERGIDFIPLKGSVMRGLYPARWMRTSADIDVLFRGDQEQEAKRLLMEELGYEEWTEANSANHSNLYSPKSRIHVETHWSLFHEVDSDIGYVELFSGIWDRAVVDPAGGGHRYMLSDADFYVYHMAHMEKHFQLSGGCSVRGLIDLWLLDRLPGADREGRAKLLAECGLSQFEDRMKKLIYAWMDGTPAENEYLEQFVLTGYLYGDDKRKATINTREKGTFGYIMQRIFMPYEYMTIAYPVLKKNPWLLPVMWVKRWGKVFDKDSRRRAGGEIKTSIKTDGQTLQEYRELAEYLGID